MLRTLPTLRFMRDEDGGPLIEAAILLPFLFLVLLGSVDLLYAFTQVSQATKAVEVGARIAAVSDPVASGLNTIPTQVVSTTVLLGDPMPNFQVTCRGATITCTCTSG